MLTPRVASTGTERQILRYHSVSVTKIRSETNPQSFGEMVFFRAVDS
jgi:hypothetical protein